MNACEIVKKLFLYASHIKQSVEVGNSNRFPIIGEMLMAIITCMQALLVACLTYNRLEKVRNSSIHSEEKVLFYPVL